MKYIRGDEIYNRNVQILKRKSRFLLCDKILVQCDIKRYKQGEWTDVILVEWTTMDNIIED